MKKVFYSLWVVLLAVLTGQAKVLKDGDLETIYRGSHSSYSGKDGQHIVEVYSEKQWDILWKEIHQGYDKVPDCPKVDFEEHSVVAAIDQIRPSTGYSLEIKAVEVIREGFSGRKQIRVSSTEIRSIHPGSAVLVGFMISRPIHIVKFKKKAED